MEMTKKEEKKSEGSQFASGIIVGIVIGGLITLFVTSCVIEIEYEKPTKENCIQLFNSLN